MRRGTVVRVVVTALAVGLLGNAWAWTQRAGGPERAFLFLYALLAAGVAVAALAWAWKRHPY